MDRSATTTPVDTQRLRLRALRAGDEQAVYRLLSDERVIRYMLFPLFTIERATAFVARLKDAGTSGPPSQMVYAIESTLGTTDVAGQGTPLIGLCGLVLRPELEEGEVWYLLSPAQWGRGFATEAVSALVTHAFQTLRLHRVWATCLPENPASARVLERLGFRREGLLREGLRIQGVWRDAFLCAMLATEWKSSLPSSSAQPG